MKAIIKILLIGIFFFSYLNMFATEIVKGKITSNGSEIAGIMILVKGTTIGTMSDLKGEFKISVPEGNQTIIFSYVKLKTVEQIIDVKSSSEYRIEVELSKKKSFCKLIEVEKITGITNNINSQTNNSCLFWDNFEKKYVQVKWTGDCVGNYAKGYGTATWKGYVVEGVATKGKLNGYGMLTNDSYGAKYIGNYKNGEFNGNGTLTKPKTTMTGEWKNNLPNGHCSYNISDDGKTYFVGNFINGQPEGVCYMTNWGRTTKMYCVNGECSNEVYQGSEESLAIGILGAIGAAILIKKGFNALCDYNSQYNYTDYSSYNSSNQNTINNYSNSNNSVALTVKSIKLDKSNYCNGSCDRYIISFNQDVKGLGGWGLSANQFYVYKKHNGEWHSSSSLIGSYISHDKSKVESWAKKKYSE